MEALNYELEHVCNVVLSIHYISLTQLSSEQTVLVLPAPLAPTDISH